MGRLLRERLALFLILISFNQPWTGPDLRAPAPDISPGTHVPQPTAPAPAPEGGAGPQPRAPVQGWL